MAFKSGTQSRQPRVSTRLKPSQREELEQIAQGANKPLSAIVRIALERVYGV